MLSDIHNRLMQAKTRLRTKQKPETLVRIAALEQDLTGRELSSHKRISACIDRVIPNDRPFTTTDVMAALEALDGGRAWRKRSVDNHLYRLRERGLLRRLKPSRRTEPAVYARLGVKVEESPFSGHDAPRGHAGDVGRTAVERD